MKKALGGLIAGAVLALSAGSALAADVAVTAPLQAPPPACGWFGGLHLGVHGGSVYYDHELDDLGGFGQGISTGLPTSVDIDEKGFYGGAQLGWTRQTGCTIWGIEADWSWSGLEASATYIDGVAPLDTLTVKSQLDWFATLRTRKGLIVNNLLLYATGGFAFAQFDQSATFQQAAPSTTEMFSTDDTRWGWTAGLGTEWTLAPNWSVKSEVLYMRFARDETSHTSTLITPGTPVRFDGHDSIWVGRIGLNYRWGDVRLW